MNYIALINQFWQLRREVTFSSTEADLYFYLLDISNGRNWKNPFQQSNSLICATIGVSEKPLITARNRLKQHGLIDFTPGVKRSPSTYKLLLLENTLENLHPNRGECDSQSGSESGSECDSLSGENPPDINKHKLKEEGSTASAASSASSLEANSVAEPKPENPVSPPAKPTRNSKKPKATADEVAALPLPHPGEAFARLWATFRASPKQTKKPLSALALMLTKLGNKPEGFAIVMLEMAIQGDWSGIENGGTAKAFEEWQAAQAHRPTAPTSPPFDPDALFGYAQSADAGLAQARNSPEYQQFLAEEAARLAASHPTETAALHAA